MLVWTLLVCSATLRSANPLSSSFPELFLLGALYTGAPSRKIFQFYLKPFHFHDTLQRDRVVRPVQRPVLVFSHFFQPAAPCSTSHCTKESR